MKSATRESWATISLVGLVMGLGLLACNTSSGGVTQSAATDEPLNSPSEITPPTATSTQSVANVASEPSPTPLPLIVRNTQDWLSDPSVFTIADLPSPLVFQGPFDAQGWLVDVSGFGYLWQTEEALAWTCNSYKAGEAISTLGLAVYQLSNYSTAEEALSEHRTSLEAWYARNTEFENLAESAAEIGDEAVVYVADSNYCGEPPMSTASVLFRRYNALGYGFITAPHLTRENTQIYLLTLAEQLAQRLTEEAEGGHGHQAAVTVQQSRIAFVSSRAGWDALYTMNPDGEAVARHTDENIVVRESGGLMEFKNTYERPTLKYPAWSPQSNYIAFRINEDYHMVGVVNVGAGWIDALGWNVGVVTDDCNVFSYDPYATRCEKEEDVALPFRPSWTRDANLMTSSFKAFTRGSVDNSGQVNYEISYSLLPRLYQFDRQRLTFEPAGVYATPFDDQPVVQTLWSSDGKFVLFEIISGSSSDSFVEIYPSDLTRIVATVPARYQAYLPAWSPDGRFVTFTSDTRGNREVFVFEVATGEVTQLTDHPASDLGATWSPQGNQIAFCSDRSGNQEIYVLNVEDARRNPATAELINISHHPADDCYPAWSPSEVGAYANFDE